MAASRPSRRVTRPDLPRVATPRPPTTGARPPGDPERRQPSDPPVTRRSGRAKESLREEVSADLSKDPRRDD
jgi:hypothetical protein